jgi:hypothetical protein
VIVGLKVPEWGILPCRLDLPAAIEHQNGAHCTLRFRTFDEKLSKRFRAYARRALSAREKLQSSQGRSSALVEAFRMVRANLEPTDRTRVLLVTSSVSGEGKTFVASGLAIVLASEGRRVLLVDADLYRPSLHRAFGLELVSGVARLLAEGNRIRLSDLTQEPRPGLAVLTGGDGNCSRLQGRSLWPAPRMRCWSPFVRGDRVGATCARPRRYSEETRLRWAASF